MGAYFVLYPHSRVLTLIPWIFLQIVELPAIVLLGFWFLMQFLSAGAIAVTAGHARRRRGVRRARRRLHRRHARRVRVQKARGRPVGSGRLLLTLRADDAQPGEVGAVAARIAGQQRHLRDCRVRADEEIG